MTGRRGPSPIETPPLETVAATQAKALLDLLARSLDWPSEIIPTRSCGQNMGTVRTLERKRLVAWRTPPGGGGQGVRVTTEGREVAEALRRAAETATP